MAKTDLMELSFYRRWQQVGERDQGDMEELLDPPVLEGHEKNFSRVAASQRLFYLDSIEPRAELQEVRPQAERSEERPKAKAKPKKKILRKFARGDFVNILMGVEDAPDVNPRGLPYDPLETVLKGQQEMHGAKGPMAVLNEQRMARFKRQPPPHCQRQILEKADALAPTPLLDASQSLEERQRRRMHLPQRLLALGEFQKWLSHVGPRHLGLQGEERISREDFVEALMNAGYPYGIIGAKVFFFYCNAREDGTISWQDIEQCLEECRRPPEGPTSWERLREMAPEDPVEDHLVNNHVGTLQRKGKNAAYSDGLESLLGRIWPGQPEVAEFMEFVFAEFGSIPMLWRLLNMSKTGDTRVVTQDEFCTALPSLRAKDGRRPVEVHMSELFDLLEPDSQGQVRLADLLEVKGRGRKGLLVRLRRFLEELTTSKKSKMKELLQIYRSPSDAFEMTAGGKATRSAFVEGLRRLRYDQWHMEDLFARIDRDGSGDITMDDFFVFLKEAGPGGRYTQPVPEEPLPNVQANARVLRLNNHSSIDASAKLSQLNDWFSEERLAQREAQKSARRPIASPCTRKLLASTSVPSLRRDLRRMGTTTRWQVTSRRSAKELRAPQELIFSYDPIPDLVASSCASCGLMELETSPSRRMVDHCLYS